MDTTPKYIKMCEKAFPILGEVPSQFLGISYRQNVYSLRGIAVDYPIIQSETCPPEGGFQVYFQDQVQAIVETEYCQPMLAQVFYEFIEPEFFCHHMDEEDENGFACPICSKLGRERRATYNSFEQWWLAFVMHEKYGKIWNDKKEEWERES